MRAFSFLFLLLALYSCKSQKTAGSTPELQKISINDSLYGKKENFPHLAISHAIQNGDSLLITVNVCQCYKGGFTLVQSSAVLKSYPVKLKLILRQDGEISCKCEETTPRRLAFDLKEILDTHRQADLLLHNYGQIIRVAR